ncbi:MAG: hypothetical protein OXR68_01840 [Alphaproteobacteria bacterium]|nr:hypothetical protein [Alphaproteobacteria bacterium]MDD9919353.1 hypothetical protein [Alphaproteobacteria bacterium]
MSKLKTNKKPCTLRVVSLLHRLCDKRLTLLFLVVLTSCSTTGVNLKNTAIKHDFVRQSIQASPFVLTAWVKQTDKEKPPHIYIEGDGRAFTNSGYTISRNPTPVKPPSGFKLAMADPHPHVIYIARPCQFTPIEQNPTCKNNKWWSSNRYDTTTLSAFNTALDKVIPNNQKVHLIGFSGGATLALLAAATRKDIASVRTVAGNIAPHAVNHFHRMQPTPFALSPIKQIEKLKNIPQVHFTGGKDKVITPPITRAYLNELPHARCTRHIQVQQASHSKGWIKKWPNLLKEEPTCIDG